jgi:histone H3/H4
MVAYRFRLAGASPPESVKLVDLAEGTRVAEIMEKVREVFQVDSNRGIYLFQMGKPLQEDTELSSFDPQKSVITVQTVPLRPENPKDVIPLTAVTALIQKAGAMPADAEAVAQLRAILDELGCEIAVLDELEDTEIYGMVEDRINRISEFISHEYTISVAAMSRLVQGATRFLGERRFKPLINSSSERVEVALRDVLENFGLEIVRIAGTIAKSAHREQITVEDINRAYKEWRIKRKLD